MTPRHRLVATLKRTKPQKALYSSTVRFGVGACGRRTGKTYGGVGWLIENTIRAPNGVGWWISPTYRQAEMAFRMARVLYPDIIVKANESKLAIYLPNNGRLDFLSAEKPDNIRGDRVSAALFDEAAHIRVLARLWDEVVRPALADLKGPARFISTPKGRNDYWDLWQRGEDPLETDWAAWRFTTYDNPFIDRSEVEAMKRAMPDLVFRQEILAEFLEDAAGVFRGIAECRGGAYAAPIRYEPYVMGVDLAKSADYTVLVTAQSGTKQVVDFDRFNQIPWSLQVQRIAAKAAQYNNALVIVDSTGVGDPIFEALQGRGVRVEGFKYTQESKRQLVENLALEIERAAIRWPANEVLENELRAFEYEIMPSGRMRYNAPPGKHDDCVNALALCSWGLVNFSAKPTEQWEGGGLFGGKR